MTADQAVEYGLIDEVLKKPEDSAEGDSQAAD
jgi:ATP-dependent protease ClpP protease subunit